MLKTRAYGNGRSWAMLVLVVLHFTANCSAFLPTAFPLTPRVHEPSEPVKKKLASSNRSPIFHFHTNRQQCGRRLARMDSSISQEEMQTTFSFRDESLVLPNGFQVACRIWGDPNATSRPEHRWLALHGWADNAASFDRLSPLLLREGAASCVVCIDAAGHGQSAHRSTYHDVDNVLDVVAVAQLLGWERFSLIGHSLGGCVAQAVAATVPDKVVRLIVLEALGWFSHDGDGALGALRKKAIEEASAKKQTWTSYPNLEACAGRRAKQNIAGVMSVEDAAVLVKRGTKPSPSGSGLVWTADESIMLTRVRVSEQLVRSILAATICPQALVITRDGLFKGANLPKLPLFSFFWGVAVFFGYWVMASIQMVKTLGRQPLRPEIPSKKSSLGSKIAFLYLLLCRRLIARRRQRLIMIDRGGHHVHLSDAQSVVQSLEAWFKDTDGGIRCDVANHLWK